MKILKILDRKIKNWNQKNQIKQDYKIKRIKKKNLKHKID